MSEHPALRSSVGSRSSERPSHHHHHQQHHSLPPQPRPQANPDPLTSVWIRRFHLTPNPPPPQPPPPRPPPLPLPPQDGVSTDESCTPPPLPLPPRSAGFGPFRWSPRPLRASPVGAWDGAAAPPGSGGGPPMMSPFFRLPAPPPPAAVDIGEFTHFRPMIGFGSSSGSGDGSGSGGFTGLSSRMVGGGGGDANAAWLAARATGAAYPSHAVDMIPIITLHDLHHRQHSMIPQNFARHAPSSSSQHDEPFSYWNMGRFRRNTTTSSISPIAVAPSNFVKKRNADSNSFLPLKFRKLSGAT